MEYPIFCFHTQKLLASDFRKRQLAGDLGEKLAQCPLQELRLDFSGCGDLESLDTLAALEIGSMSRVDWCFPRCTALMVRDDFWKALHLKSLHSLRGLSHLSLNFAHCLGLQEVPWWELGWGIPY